MFVLAMISDTIRVPPTLLNQPTLTSITAEIEKRYPNRIIVDVGLVVTLYNEVLSIGDGILACGDGGAHHECVFRLVVFRPFVEEVLVGTVEESNEEGIRVSVGGFFDDVFIPAYWMLNPSKYDDATGLWVGLPPTTTTRRRRMPSKTKEAATAPKKMPTTPPKKTATTPKKKRATNSTSTSVPKYASR